MKNLLNRLTKVALLMLLLVDRTPNFGVYANAIVVTVPTFSLEVDVDGKYNAGEGKYDITVDPTKSIYWDYSFTEGQTDAAINTFLLTNYQISPNDLASEGKEFTNFLITKIVYWNGGSREGTIKYVGIVATFRQLVTPIAVADSISTPEDTSKIIWEADLMANDTNLGTLVKDITSFTSTSNGTLVDNGNGSFTYTPNTNYVGPDSFTYTLNGLTLIANATTTVSISVVAVDDAPLAYDDSASTNEDTPINISVLANDTDLESNLITILSFTQPTNGVVTNNGNGTLRYTPSLNFNGSDSFTYTINGGDTATVNVTVNSVNDPGDAVDDTASTLEDTLVDINVLANDLDVEGNAVVASVTQPLNGQTLINLNGTVKYTPSLNFEGVDYFTYTLDTGDSANVAVTVSAVNDTPVAVNDTASTPEDTLININVLGNDTDVDGGTKEVDLVGVPSHGTAIENLDGTISYTPTLNYVGADSFTYTLNGGSIATVSITVTAVNDTPVAVNDTASTPEDTLININVLGNDTDVDGGTKEVDLVGVPSHGTAIENLDGTISYTPTLNYVGADSFTYTLNGGSIATVSITVTAVDDIPIAVNDTASTPEDTLININVLGNDTDVDGGTKEVDLVGVPSHGTAIENLDGTISYTPTLNYVGADSFTYTLNGGSIATVSITVTAVNDVPVAVADTYTAFEDTPLTIVVPGVLANDTDVENNGLTAAVLIGFEPTRGSINLNPDGSFTYTPFANLHGEDTFMYKITDGNSATATALVTINVQSEEDNPLANPKSFSVNEGSTYNGFVTGTDDDGDVLLFELVTSPVNGTLSFSDLGVFEYSHNGSETIADSFTFRVSDDDGLTFSAPATVSITVNPINDAPIANPQTVTTPEDTARSITLTGSDAETNPLLLFGVTIQPLHGTLSGTAPNLIYTPALNYVGPDSFTFALSDGYYRASNVVNITVTPVDDRPVANLQNLTTAEDTTLSITLTGSDVETNPISLFGVTIQPLHGTLSGTAPNLVYTPALNYVGPDSFTFALSDGYYRASNVINIEVTPVNDPPVATPQTLSTPEDTALPIVLAATDVEGSVSIYGILSAPSHGILTGTGSNRTYTPDLNYSGPDSFTFGVSDGFYRSFATVTIDVIPVNDLPIATPQTLITAEDTALPITLAGTDIETTPITLFGVTVQPLHGTLTGTAPSLIYTPALNYVGPDSFTFAISDGFFRDTAVVSITVTSVEDIPVAIDDPDLEDEVEAFETPEDTPYVFDLDTLLANDYDPDDSNIQELPEFFSFQLLEDPIIIRSFDFNTFFTPSVGSLALNMGARTLTYTPPLNYVGPVTFGYNIIDTDENISNTAVVTLTVTPVNDVPVANPLAFSVPNAGTSTGSVTATDIDLPANTLTYSLLTPATNGTATVSPTGAYTYTHNGTGTLVDSFVFSVTDGTLSATATVTVTVLAAPTPPPPPPANLAPSATAITFSVANAGTNTGTLSGSDPEGATLSFTLVGAPANGTVVISPAGAYSYTHNGTTTVTDSFTFAVSDGAISTTATVSITVRPIPAPGNNPPVVIDGVDDGAFGEEIVGTLLPLGSDADGDPLTFTVLVGPTNGTFVLNLDGTFTYTPDANFTGVDSFSFIASDGTDDSNEGTFTLDVLEEVVILTEPVTPLAAVNNDWLWWLLALLAGLLLWLLAFLRPNMKYTLTDNGNNQKVVRRRLAKPDNNTMLVELSDKDMLNIQTIDVELYKRLAKHLGNVTINFQLNGKVIHSVTLPEGIKDSFETIIRF